MKLDSRIKDKEKIYDVFNCQEARKGSTTGYFTDNFAAFADLKTCCRARLVTIEEDNPHPFYAGIVDGGCIIKGNFQFFTSVDNTDEGNTAEGKKSRPFTFMEFQDKFTVGMPLKFREKGKFGCERYMILSGYGHELRNGLVTTYIYIGPHPYSLDELFNCYEWQEHYTSDFQPFGVEDTE